jgi:acyl-CoA reductase-like NAD-dependent aldehyde dehydrogenase
VSLELGGKSPAIVFEDADIKKVCSRFLRWGRTANADLGVIVIAGCRGCRRSLLQRRPSVRGEFSHLRAQVDCERIRRRVPGRYPNSRRAIPFGGGVVNGPLVDKIQFDKVLKYLDEGKAAAGQTLVGGS